VRRNVLSKTLRDQRWQVVGYGLAMAAMAATAVWLWPSVRDTLQNFEIPPAIQALLGSNLDLSTAAGYLSGRYFSWTIILVLVYVIVAGTGAVAGEEGAGTMDLLLAQPISRTAVLLEKVTAIALGAAAIVALGFVGFLVSIPTVDIEVTLGDVAIASANMLPVAMLFLALSVWAGAALPSRGVASGLVIGIVTAAYFIYSLSNGVESLQWMRYASPFYYYGSGLPLVRGIEWAHVALLSGLAILFVWLSVRMFEVRDIASGRGELNLRRWFGGSPQTEVSAPTDK
jgi:ABC-2 type transport system permease protein